MKGGDQMKIKKRKRKKIRKWVQYLIGFSGKGPTTLDTKPSCILGRKEKKVVLLLKKEMEQEQIFRQACFEKACIDVLGEDPDDWG